MGRCARRVRMGSLRVMGDSPSSPRGLSGVLAVVTLVVASLAAVGIWYARESASEARIAEALAPYATASLPQVGEPVDEVLADLGSRLFRKRCSACHTIHGEDKVGPDLAGVTQVRDYAWISGMILSPDSMTLLDPTARELKQEFTVQMVTPKYFEDVHALAIVEFLRQVDSGGDS